MRAYSFFSKNLKKAWCPPKPAPPRGGVGLGWVGLGWVVARTTGGCPRPVYPSLTGTTGSYPGCLVSQPSRLLTTPEPHQGAGGREMPPCPCVLAAHVQGRVGGTPGLTMGWCLALLVLQGASRPSVGFIWSPCPVPAPCTSHTH